MKPPDELARCRICDNTDLEPILDLGEQALTGVFPEHPDETVPAARLELVKCMEDGPGGGCGLVQLRHSVDLHLMYGEHYGYRSGLNKAMIRHLRRTVAKICDLVHLDGSDLVLDIGSNDATLLRAYPMNGPALVGIDPIGAKFASWYPPHIQLITGFFSRDLWTARFGERRPRVITSIAMFYDLPSPLLFMRDVHDILADDGIWVLEQSYLPSMLEATAYDTVCHEHLEYYALRQIEWMADRVGFTILEAELNGVNGGSFRLILAKRPTRRRYDSAPIDRLRALEAEHALHTLRPFEEFAARAARHREAIRSFFVQARRAGRLTLGYGASTKGNVLLQYCGIGADDLPCVADANPDKFGRYTPGTRIPIVSEAEGHSRHPDQFLVLPWHFHDVFIEKERDFLASGGRLVFPLPRLTVVGGTRRSVEHSPGHVVEHPAD